MSLLLQNRGGLVNGVLVLDWIGLDETMACVGVPFYSCLLGDHIPHMGKTGFGTKVLVMN